MEREEVGFIVGGTRCAAWLFRPSGTTPSPCVVMGSGLSCVLDQGLDLYGERFAAAGFSALAFDYRHFGDSDGQPRTLLSARMQRQDFRAALAFARSHGGVDPGRIAIWGFSFGGAHAQQLAIADPSIAAAIFVAPTIDGVRSLLHMGGPGHALRVIVAGVRDLGRAARGGGPYRIPATGPPASGAVLCTGDAIEGFEAVTGPESSWRNDLCARGAAAPPYHLERSARRIRCPSLYCIVEDDEVNPPELGAKTARGVPAAELRLNPGGHFSPFIGETFERVVADQNGFLERKL
jgi:pimeloyl-ACP methyl ester carboxylesterase